MKYYTTAVDGQLVIKPMTDWCRIVVGRPGWDLNIQGDMGNHGCYHFCLEFRFDNARHKFLFDLAFSHLELWDSAEQFLADHADVV
jgi:hypothetical protein